jgi:hypothetical protein
MRKNLPLKQHAILGGQDSAFKAARESVEASTFTALSADKMCEASFAAAVFVDPLFDS